MKLLLLLIVCAGVLSAVLYTVRANDASVSAELQVAVRQLRDGRIEFAIVHDGAYHYPRARVIRPELGHSRWLQSSPVWIEVPLPTIGRRSLDHAFAQVEATCGTQLSYFEDWRPPDLFYSVTQADDQRDLARQRRDACHGQLNVALQVLALASLQETVDPETALQYSISIDTTRLISDWTYHRMIDLIASHSIRT